MELHQISLPCPAKLQGSFCHGGRKTTITEIRLGTGDHTQLEPIVSCAIWSIFKLRSHPDFMAHIRASPAASLSRDFCSWCRRTLHQHSPATCSRCLSSDRRGSFHTAEIEKNHQALGVEAIRGQTTIKWWSRSRSMSSFLYVRITPKSTADRFDYMCVTSLTLWQTFG